MKYSLRDRVNQLAALTVLLFAAIPIVWLPMTMAHYASEIGTKPISSVLSMLAAVVIAGLFIWPAWEVWKPRSNGRKPTLPGSQWNEQSEPPLWGEPPPLP